MGDGFHNTLFRTKDFNVNSNFGRISVPCSGVDGINAVLELTGMSVKSNIIFPTLLQCRWGVCIEYCRLV